MGDGKLTRNLSTTTLRKWWASVDRAAAGAPVLGGKSELAEDERAVLDAAVEWKKAKPIKAGVPRQDALAKELIEAARTELRGKRLGCWCAPLPCHGDVLSRVAEGGEP